MIDLSMFALGVLALLAVWKFMLRPSIQDTFKDALFDVRDNLRQHFAKRGQIDTLTYRDLRDSLNGYIRFIEVANLALTFQYSVRMSDHPKVAERYSRELDRRFDVQIPELATLAKASRKRCSRIIQFYVFHSSLLSTLFIYLVLLPSAIGHESFRFCRERAVRSGRSFALGVRRYIQVQEDRAIEPHFTELFAQMAILRFALGLPVFA